MRIANNIPALTTSITLKATDRQVVDSMQRLSTGNRINSAKNDAAGLAIANKLGIQVTGLNRAGRNSMDGISLVQTADGSLNQVTSMLQRMRELAVQAASGVLTPVDKQKIQAEVNQLVQEINDNAYKTEFNKIKLLNGESAVLTQSLTRAGFLGNEIATILYVSPSVPPGRLEYTINRPGLPAEVSVNPSALMFSDVTFTINEVSVVINANDNLQAVRDKLNEAANLAALELKFDSAGMGYFATKTAGSAQTITLTSTAARPELNVTRSGQDAELDLTRTRYYGLNGLPDADFNSSISVRAEGNKVTIASTNGKIIQLGLKVYFNPDVSPGRPHFVYGNGSYNDTPPYSGGAPVDSAIPMSANIKDYGQLYLQTGPNYNQHMPLNIPRLNAETLGFIEYIGGAMKITLDYQSTAGANRAIAILDKALADVSQVRSWLGAYQNRLEQTVMNLDSASINMETARSRIQDTDMALAMTEYSQYNVKYQAGLAVLAQANQRPQQVLSLLQ